MRTVRRGNSAEAAVLRALVDRGFGVFLPFGDGHPVDLIVQVSGGLLRVQCKTAWISGGCALFNSHATDHGNGERSYAGVADIFGVYLPPRDAVYLVPVQAVTPTEGRLRLEPTRNNQRRRVRFASEFEIDRWSDRRLSRLVRGAPERPQLELSSRAA